MPHRINDVTHLSLRDRLGVPRVWMHPWVPSFIVSLAKGVLQSMFFTHAALVSPQLGFLIYL